MLVNATRMLRIAHENHYAVGHFNINNLEWTKAILLTAEELQSPVILGVSEGAAKYMGGFKVVAAMVKALDESLKITVPVALHLDHGSYDGVKACIEAGFTSVMFDGSHFPLEENIQKTKELVALAHDKGLSIEAEVGAIGGTEDGVTADGEVADPEECAKIVALGVDFLAAGIGNIHGIYPKKTGKDYILMPLKRFQRPPEAFHLSYMVEPVSQKTKSSMLSMMVCQRLTSIPIAN